MDQRFNGQYSVLDKQGTCVIPIISSWYNSYCFFLLHLNRGSVSTLVFLLHLHRKVYTCPPAAPEQRDHRVHWSSCYTWTGGSWSTLVLLLHLNRGSLSKLVLLLHLNRGSLNTSVEQERVKGGQAFWLSLELAVHPFIFIIAQRQWLPHISLLKSFLSLCGR